jgi:prophage regulatory protein
MSQTNQYPSTLFRRPQVESMTGLKRSSIYALMKCGQFPHPVKLSARAVAWRSDDINGWIQNRTYSSTTSTIVGVSLG